jgi:hypothetical protein
MTADPGPPDLDLAPGPPAPASLSAAAPLGLDFALGRGPGAMVFIHVGVLAAGQHLCSAVCSGPGPPPTCPACGKSLAPATLSPARWPSSTCSRHHRAHLEAPSWSASACASACGARWWSFTSTSAGARSSLLAGLDALWHSGAPSPTVVSSTVLGCLSYPAFALGRWRWHSLRHIPS